MFLFHFWISVWYQYFDFIHILHNTDKKTHTGLKTTTSQFYLDDLDFMSEICFRDPINSEFAWWNCFFYSYIFFYLNLIYSDLSCNCALCVSAQSRGGVALQLPARFGRQLLQHSAPQHHRIPFPWQQRSGLRRLQVHTGEIETSSQWRLH